MNEFRPSSSSWVTMGEGGEPLPIRRGYPAGFAGRFRESDLEPAEMSLLDFVRLFRRHWLLILALVAICGGIGAYKALTTAVSYRAAALIRLQDSQRALTGVQDETRPNLGGRAEPITSLLEVMRSEAVLSDVVDRSALRLREITTGAPPTFLQDVEIEADARIDTLRLHFSDGYFTVEHEGAETVAAYGDPVQLPGMRFTVASPAERAEAELVLVSRDGILRNLRSGLQTVQRERTDLVDVQYSARNPVLAQVVVNEVVDAFQRNSVRLSQQQSRRRRVFLEEQLREAQEAQEAAQYALSRFRGSDQVFGTLPRASEQQGLHTVSTRREELETQREFYGAILGDLERAARQPERGITTLVAYPGTTSNPVVSALLQQLIRHQSAREELVTGELGVRPDHPDVVRLDGLIAQTQDRLIQAVRSQIDVMDSQIATLSRQQQRSAQQLRQIPDAEAEEVRLVQRANAAGRLTESLESELQKARIAEAIELGQVEILERASRPGASRGGNLSMNLLLGMMAGLLLGGGSAFVLERVNTSIRREDELSKALSVPALAVIPRIETNGGNGHRAWYRLPISRIYAGPRRLTPGSAGTATLPDTMTKGANGANGALHHTGLGAEAYRTLRTNLIFSPALKNLKCAVVTSAAPREGKTTTVANLAISCAQHGMKVLLIDADLRRPRQHEVFAIPRSPGVTDLLTGAVAAADAVRSTPVEGLFLLSAGTTAPNPAELIGGTRMQEFLAAMREQFDLILIDTPPLLAVSDATILAASADGVIVVVHAGSTDRDTVLTAVEKLRSLGTEVIGTVLNDPDAKVVPYAGYHRYGYEYTAGD